MKCVSRWRQGSAGRLHTSGGKEIEFSAQLFDFGSPVMFRVCGKSKCRTLEEGGFEGHLRGKKAHSEEYLVMLKNGHVVKARAVKETARMVDLSDLDHSILQGPSVELFETREHANHKCLTRSFLERRDQTCLTLKRVQITKDVGT